MKLVSYAFPASLLAALFLTSSASAQAPSGSTGECKDGTYTSAATKSGACAGHKGVKDWYTAKSDAKAVAPDAKAASPAAKTTTQAPAAPAPTMAQKPSGMPTEAAAGGGAGKVWVNTSSKVYHCSGDKWYGKTKKGEYMTEADAKAKGAHADHKKACV